MYSIGLIFVVLAVWLQASAATPPNIVFIMADDLGYNDLGLLNGKKTITPEIDALFEEGIFLSNAHTYKVCAPSRAMTMSGRSTTNIGFFDMSLDSQHCVNSSYKLLPEVLKEAGGYRTHAAGKWDCGYLRDECTPTERGFESFIGYYTACTSDYWYHGAPGGNATASECGGVDFSNSTAAGGIHGATMAGPGSVNGTYDRNVFTDRAVEIIQGHNPSEPLFLYVAFHNVHDSCQHDRFALGLDAPAETVELYPTTKLDTWKVQAAMTTELSYGVGNITEALKAANMYNDTVVLFASDNGGPLSHSSNAPKRAGKGTWFQGGVNVVAGVLGGMVPANRRGSKWDGLMYYADWYTTLVEGVAGVSMPADTGERPPDGFNLWDAILSDGPSPRKEIIHGVLGSEVVPPLTKEQCSSCSSAAATFIVNGTQYKFMQNIKSGPGVQAWPTPGTEAVPFGLTGGQKEPGTDHWRAPLLEGDLLPQDLQEDGNMALRLYDLDADPSEMTDISGDAKYASMIKDFQARMKAYAAAAPPPAHIDPPNFATILCNQQKETGYLEPVDWRTNHTNNQ